MAPPREIPDRPRYLRLAPPAFRYHFVVNGEELVIERAALLDMWVPLISLYVRGRRVKPDSAGWRGTLYDLAELALAITLALIVIGVAVLGIIWLWPLTHT